MSDYLGHLAARSLDPAATAVRPRLASRFEPLSPWAPPLAMERAAEEPVALEAPAARPGRARRIVEEEREPSAKDVKRSGVRPAVPAPVVAVAPSPQGQLAHASVPPFEPSPPVLPSRREKRTVAPADVADPDRSQRSTALQPTPRQDAPVASPLSHRERVIGREDSRARRSGGPQPTEKREAGPALQPRVTVVERGPFPARRQETAPVPTIQVTIGRIEVRATPPPAQPSRPRPSAPSALSLEDYLRQRAKGGQG